MSYEFFITKLMPALLGFMTGSCIGSGLLCFLMRRRAGESWMHGRSHCDSCRHTLTAIDLIPIASYLAFHGKCRYCGAKIPPICCIAECVYGVFAALFALDWATYHFYGQMWPQAIRTVYITCCVYSIAYFYIYIHKKQPSHDGADTQIRKEND